ncbi:MAG: nucleotidyltransferase family protein [Bacteroidales bacterium]
MECIVLAGGLGTRLRSVVSDLPKCMAPVAGQPFLYYIFHYLQKNGCTHVILSLGFKHEVIEEWVMQNDWSFTVSFAIEQEPLGTGGAIKLALEKSKEEQVFIMNGDTFFDVNLKEMFENHADHTSDLSIALKKMTNFDRYGTVKVNADSRITAFQEKEYCTEGYINGGTYLINKKSDLMDKLPAKFSFETAVLQSQNKRVMMSGYVSDGYFIDIGIPTDFTKANIDFKELY